MYLRTSAGTTTRSKKERNSADRPSSGACRVAIFDMDATSQLRVASGKTGVTEEPPQLGARGAASPLASIQRARFECCVRCRRT